LNLLLIFELLIIGIGFLAGLAFALNTTIGLSMTCDYWNRKSIRYSHTYLTLHYFAITLIPDWTFQNGMYDVLITAVFYVSVHSCIGATINDSNFYVSILESEVCHGRFLTEKQLYAICLIFWLQVAAWLAAAVLLLLFVIYVVLMVAYCRHIRNWRSPKYTHFPEETVQSQNHFDYGTTKSTNPFD